jgi:hypothetical protein
MPIVSPKTLTLMLWGLVLLADAGIVAYCIHTYRAQEDKVDVRCVVRAEQFKYRLQDVCEGPHNEDLSCAKRLELCP